jgi:hypothetical protein
MQAGHRLINSHSLQVRLASFRARLFAPIPRPLRHHLAFAALRALGAPIARMTALICDLVGVFAIFYASLLIIMFLSVNPRHPSWVRAIGPAERAGVPVKTIPCCVSNLVAPAALLKCNAVHVPL